MPPTLTRVDDRLVLDLSTAGRGAAFNDALNKVREIPGKQFDWDTKLWSFPDEPMVADRILRTIQPTAEPELLEWIRQSRTRSAEEVTTPLPDDAEVLVPWGNKRMPWQPEAVNDLEFSGLFPYQRSAVAHIARELRAILADDMGLGKTLQAISVVEEYRLRNPLADGTLIDGPKLIVAPKSVKGGWLRELNRWLEPGTFDVQVIDASNPKKRHDQITYGIVNNYWIVHNWEALRTEHVIVEINHRNGLKSKEKRIKMKEPLFQVPWAAHMGLSLDDLDPRAVDKLRGIKDRVKAGKWLAVIADEVHRAKNHRAKQTKGLHRTEGQLMLGLTGTPVMNSPDELWSLLHWLWPYEYTSHQRFFEQYVDYYEENYGERKGIVITGVKNPDALRFELKGRIVRRTAEEAAKAMGTKMPGHRRLYVEMDLLPAQRKAYKDAEKEMWLAIEKDIDAGDPSAARFGQAVMAGDIAAMHRIPNGGARTVRLRQIIENLALLGGPDVSAAMDDFEDRFWDSRPEPWVVFCAFRESATLLAERLRKRGANVAIYTGEQSGPERTRMEDKFQRGELDAIIGTTGALKEGITLTRTNRGYFLSRDWVPATDEQAERRYANRTGQQRYSTTYIPQAIDTVAVTKVEPTNRLKEKIVKAIHTKDEIQEVHV